MDDKGTVLGLDQEYKTLGKKQDRDGYENWLTTLLLDAFGKDAGALLRLSFHQMSGKDLCQVSESLR